MSKAWRKNTNKMQQYRYLLSIQVFNIDYCLDMFRASLCTSSGEKDHVLLHMGLFAGSVGCGWLRYCGVALQGVSTVKVAAQAVTFTVLTPCSNLQTLQFTALLLVCI